MNIPFFRNAFPALLALVLLCPGCENPQNSGGSETVEPELRGRVTIVGSVFIGGTLRADISALGGTGTVSCQWLRVEDAE